MARNVNVTISSEDDATTRDGVPDLLVHLSASWIDNAGDPQSASVDRYLLLQLNWFLTTYPSAFQREMQEVVFRIERVRQGIDGIDA